MVGVPVAGNQGSPSFPQQFGVIQDVSVDIDQKLVDLRGQDKFPDDTAPSDMTIKGKAAFGKIEIDTYNSLFFADTITTGVIVFVTNETGTIPAVTGPYTIQVSGHSTFVGDLGVLFAATGAPLVKVVSGPTTGQYSVDISTGTYTFAAADTLLGVLISYTKTDSSNGRTLTVKNHIQGYGPVFELYLALPYQGNNGLKLFRARASKMNAPLKRDGYMIPDFEFTAYADASGNVMAWYQASA